jgi:hypothetical protein
LPFVSETNYETCGDGAYMATSGVLALTTVTPNVKGTLSNTNFTHVTVDPDTYHSTPVGDCTSSITSIAFDFPVTTDPAFTGTAHAGPRGPRAFRTR